jgi:hypothetical protein
MTARTGVALDQAERDGVAIAKDQRNSWSSGVDRDRGSGPYSDNNLWTECYQLSRECRNLLIPALVATIFDA